MRLDVWNAKFMDHKETLEKPEEKEETKKDSVESLKSPCQRKKIKTKKFKNMVKLAEKEKN